MPLLAQPVRNPDAQANQAFAQNTNTTRTGLAPPPTTAPSTAVKPTAPVATVNTTPSQTPTAMPKPAQPNPARAAAVSAATSQLSAYRRAAGSQPAAPRTK